MNPCYICERHKEHGGICNGKWDDKSCLLFIKDPRGKRLDRNIYLNVPFGREIPKPKEVFEIEVHGIEILQGFKGLRCT
ncbi:MAG: hypothetical protein ABFD18_06360 [Syntrophomonas sp.]